MEHPRENPIAPSEHEIESRVQEEVARGEVSQDRARRFYDRIRQNIHDFNSRKGAVGKTGELLMLVPDMFMLLWRLATDSRVAGKDKVLLGTGIAYFILPFDLIPEAIVGPIGYLDDLVFAVYVLNKMLTRTDPAILREHWSGDGDVLEKIQNVLNTADTLVETKVSARLKKMLKRD
jgi:uncharacterized membrane protein YkvA (DUF1232 family)